MSLAGQPDACRPLEGQVVVLRPFEAGRWFFGLPSSLRLARDASGKPDLRLTMVASAGERPYGVLEIGVEPVVDLGEALKIVRRERADASVLPISMAGGFSRVGIVGGDFAECGHSITYDAPQPVHRTSTGGWRITGELSPEATTLVAEGLRSGTLGLEVVLEMEFDAVAHRLAGRATMDPKTVHEALWKLAGESGALERAALAEALRASPSTLGITLAGVSDERWLVEALVDRLRVRFGRLGPASKVPVRASFALAKAGTEQSGALVWDLSEAMLTRRGWTASLDAIGDAQRSGAELADCVHQITTPPVDTGERRLLVRGDLGLPVGGMAQAGVTIRIAPALPQRPQGISKTFAITGDVLDESFTVRLAAGETLKYEVQGFSFVGSPPVRLQGPARMGMSRVIRVGREDIGAKFIDVAMSPALAAQADVTVKLRAHHLAREVTLDGRVPQPPGVLSLALHPDATDAALDVVAIERGGTGLASVLSLPASSMVMLDLTTFPQFGVHRVVATSDGEDARAWEVELESEGGERGSMMVHGAPATWAYTSASVFRAGYRFRRRVRGQDAWSDWTSRAFNEEAIMSDDQGGSAPRSKPSHDADGSSSTSAFARTIDGVFVVALDDSPRTLRYIAGAPSVSKDQSGSASRGFFASELGPDREMVQFETRWEPTQAQLANVLASIRSILGPDAEVPTLEPAVPIECEFAIVRPGSEGGQEVHAAIAQATPPFSGVVRIMGSKGDVSPIRRSLEGEAGLAFIRYRTRFTGIPTVVARLQGRIDPRSESADRLKAIEQAIESGQLQLSLDAMPGATSDLFQEARRRAIGAAAIGDWPDGVIDISQTIKSESVRIERWCDLASPGVGDGSPPAWAKAANGQESVSRVAADSPSQTKRKVEIDGRSLDASSVVEVKGTVEYRTSTGVIAREPFVVSPAATLATVWLPVGPAAPGDTMHFEWTERRSSGFVTTKRRDVDPVSRLVLE